MCAMITLTVVRLWVLILHHNVHNPKYSDDFRSSMYHCNLCRSFPKHYHSQGLGDGIFCEKFPRIVNLTIGHSINDTYVISGPWTRRNLEMDINCY